MNAEQYRAVIGWFNARPAAKKALRLVSRGAVGLVYLLYLGMLVWLALHRSEQLWPAAIVPAAAFLVGTLVRRVIDRPRPYTALGFAPLFPKDKPGQSMPSRHCFSAAAIAGAAWYVLRMDQGDGMAYLTEPVTIGNITRTVNATGEVGAVQLVSVGAQVGGQIKKLHVVLGQDVKKGDLIAEIDSVPQLNQLETDKARLQSYESQLAAKKVALKIAKTKYDREMQLKKRDAASKESLEDAENAYALAKAEVTELESQIRQARIAVNTDEVNLGYTRITAPLDGTIVSVPVDEGQTVNANQTTPTIVQIADLDKMEIKIEISEGDITAVKPGMPITYTILSNPETEYKATLTSIDPGLTTLTDGSYKTTSSTGSSASSSSSSSSNNAVYYYGKALIDNKEGPLRIGMTTQNVITVADVKDALLVPVIAVQSRNGKKFVRVLGPGDKPERREVTTGIADGIHIQILSGLKEGDAVITAQVTQQERDAQVQQRHRGPRL